MRLIRSVDDPGDNGDGGGGGASGGGGVLFKRKWVDVNWSFPPTAPTPSAFEVVIFTGTDPNDTSAYLFEPIRVLSVDRRLVRSFFPKTTLTNVNAAVRAIYA